MPREISVRYRDPLDVLWIRTAGAIGLRVVESRDTYASTDGQGTLLVAAPEDRDPDDCLAQMIFHELCHSLVMGPESFAWVDWGLDNEGDRDVKLEHACLRLQAALARPWGLHRVLAPTTDFRAYFDALPPDPFQERSPSERESIVRGRAALHRARHLPWTPHLSLALSATRSLLEASHQSSSAHLPELGHELLLHDLLTATSSPHPVGFREHPSETRTCADCAWSYRGGPGRPVLRCRQADGARIEPGWRACECFEIPFECTSCGACCREAYDTVVVSKRDPVVRKHLRLLTPSSSGFDVGRRGDRCIALEGGVDLPRHEPAIGSASSEHRPAPPLAMPGPKPFTCAIYDDRPKTCRDFSRAGTNCRDARRRVGLSR